MQRGNNLKPGSTIYPSSVCDVIEANAFTHFLLCVRLSLTHGFYSIGKETVNVVPFPTLLITDRFP